MSYVEITYDRVLYETETAVKLLLDDRHVWLPFSTIRDIDGPEELDPDGDTIEVRESIAIEKELC